MGMTLRLIVVLFLLFLTSCQSSYEKDWQLAQKAYENKNYKQAAHFYEKVFKLERSSEKKIKVSYNLANIYYFYVKDFIKSKKYYRYYLVHTEKRKEKIKALSRLANLSFSIFNNYKEAILHYNRLLKIDKDDNVYFYRLQIARSYFFLNNFYQSQVEIQSVLKDDKNPFLFESLLLLGNIYLAEKKTEESIKVLLSLVEKFPQRSIKENVLMTIAVSYEELRDFDKAIEILEKMASQVKDPAFVNSRIRSLMERKKNLPKKGRL